MSEPLEFLVIKTEISSLLLMLRGFMKMSVNLVAFTKSTKSWRKGWILKKQVNMRKNNICGLFFFFNYLTITSFPAHEEEEMNEISLF